MALIRGIESLMSEVISFRLNKDNPRESTAWQVLKRWNAKGFNVRYIITEALIKLDEVSVEPTAMELYELHKTLCQVNESFERIGNANHPPLKIHYKNQPPSKLTNTFIASVKKSVKPGVITK